MTVGELIEFLKKFPPSMPVAYEKYSEQCLLEENEIEVADLCEARPDGWVADRRPDKTTVKYLLLPGN